MNRGTEAYHSAAGWISGVVVCQLDRRGAAVAVAREPNESKRDNRRKSWSNLFGVFGNTQAENYSDCDVVGRCELCFYSLVLHTLPRPHIDALMYHSGQDPWYLTWYVCWLGM